MRMVPSLWLAAGDAAADAEADAAAVSLADGDAAALDAGALDAGAALDGAAVGAALEGAADGAALDGRGCWGHACRCRCCGGPAGGHYEGCGDDGGEESHRSGSSHRSDLLSALGRHGRCEDSHRRRRASARGLDAAPQ